MTKTDKALVTARDVLLLKICECGDVAEEHLMIGDDTRCRRKGCRCQEFRPVTFTVERAQ